MAKRKIFITYDYMIGDGNGNIKEKISVSLDNPFVKRYCDLLNKLKPVKGSWGLILNEETIYKAFEEKQITEDDYNFLSRTMFKEYDEEISEYFKTKKENEFANEFHEGVYAEKSYSFLVFEGVKFK